MCEGATMRGAAVHGRMVRRTVVLGGIIVLVLAWPAPAGAQEARPSPFAIDTAASIDTAVDANADNTWAVFMDAVVSVGLGRGFEVVTWPVVQRAAATREWTGDLWIASLRYERAGRVGVRVDGGLIPSPIGLANLTVRRPHLNPTIASPASLFSSLPGFEFRGPRTNLLGAVYPFGGQVTVSGARWDARAAVIDTSPLRRRRILYELSTNPPRFGNIVAGAGVTPFVGFRVGASMARGGWARAGESPAITADMDATVFTVESELSFAFTKLAAEWVRDTVDTSSGTHKASGWFVQGQQTLAPRWFAAARVERIDSPLVTPLVITRQRMTNTEEVLAFRLTPELTVRGGHRARRGFGRPGYDHQVEVSLVWWKRWV
jgi:hypothetical protein